MKKSNKILLDEKEKSKTKKADDGEEDPIVNASDYALVVKNLPSIIPDRTYSFTNLNPNIKKHISKGRKCKRKRRHEYETPDFSIKPLYEEEVLRAELVNYFEERYGRGIVTGVNHILLTQNISEKVKLIKKINSKIKEKEILINKQRFAAENYEKFKIKPTEEDTIRFVEKRSNNWLKRILCCLFLKSKNALRCIK